jgi:hypothetical protein
MFNVINQNLKYSVIIFFMFSYSSSFSQMIHQKPIVFDVQRKELSLLYLQNRYGITKSFPDIDPKIVVVHWTGFPQLEVSHSIMNDPTLSKSRTDIEIGGNLNVSAHYLIDRNGDIYSMLPDTIFARHVIGLNYYAIGIENVGNNKNPLTDDQLEANVQLITSLIKKYDIQYVIGHYEYKLFIDHPYWLEKDSSYLTEKIDPGVDFMQKLRMRLKDFDIAGPPLPND